MVTTISIIHKTVKALEKYFLLKNNFRLTGESYDLIMFLPSDKFASDTKYSLLVSAEILDKLNQKSATTELLEAIKPDLDFNEYNSISRVNILDSNEPIVKNLKLVFGFRQEIFEINREYIIGGVNIEFAYIVKSLVLDKLVIGNAITAEVLENGQRKVINAGIIRIEKDYKVVYYTGKGLRQLFGQEGDAHESNTSTSLYTRPKGESHLIEKGYISSIPLDNIIRIL